MVKNSYILAGLLLSLFLAVWGLIYLSVNSYQKHLIPTKEAVPQGASTSTAQQQPISPSAVSPSQPDAQPLNEEQSPQSSPQQWLQSLPLHKNNLTFVGRENTSVLEHSSMGCSPIEQFHLPSRYQVSETKNKCELYTYSDGTKSMFYFENDILRARDELTSGNHVTARYIFFPPPTDDPKDDPLVQLPIQGLVVQEQFYQNSTVRVNTFGPDGFVLQKVEGSASQSGNEPEMQQMNVLTYLPNHQFTGYTKGTRKKDSPLLTQRLELSNSSHSSLPANTYKVVTSSSQGKKTKTGSWTLNKKTNTVVLDNGRQFPPSDTLPRAKTYCEIYSTGCNQIPAPQENEIAIIK